MVSGLKARSRRFDPTVEVYEEHSDVFLTQWGKRRYRIPPLLREQLKELPKGSHILDLGCGAGQDLFFLQKKGHHPVGLDGTWAFLRWAKKRSPRIHVIYGDLRRLPFRENRFDGVWAAASLIHLSKSDVRKTLKSIISLLTPGGQFGATFVHGKKSGRLQRGWIPGRYFSRWLKNELADLLISTGWKIERLKTVSNRERKGRWLNVRARRPALIQANILKKGPL